MQMLLAWEPSQTKVLESCLTYSVQLDSHVLHCMLSTQEALSFRDQR